MRKRDYILFAVTIISILLSSIFIYSMPEKQNAILQIRIEDKIYGEYDLNVDQNISINDTNTCVIKDKTVTMTNASCPDKLCVHTLPINQYGGTIICLPNRVILEIITKDNEIDATT